MHRTVDCGLPAISANQPPNQHQQSAFHSECDRERRAVNNTSLNCDIMSLPAIPNTNTFMTANEVEDRGVNISMSPLLTCHERTQTFLNTLSR